MSTNDSEGARRPSARRRAPDPAAAAPEPDVSAPKARKRAAAKRSAAKPESSIVAKKVASDGAAKAKPSRSRGAPASPSGAPALDALEASRAAAGGRAVVVGNGKASAAPRRASARRPSRPSVSPSTPAPSVRVPPMDIPPMEPPAPERVEERARKLRPAVRRSAPPPAPTVLDEGELGDEELVPTREEPNPIFELEESVDRMIEAADSIDADPHARRRAAEALTELAARLGGYDPKEVPEDDDSILDNARALFSPDTYLRRWGRFGLRNRSEEVDEFGLDRTYEERLAPVFEALYAKWFRVQVRGVAHVPSAGRAMIVANHGGALPLDGLMVRTALRLEHPGGREARWLAEDFSYHMPFLGAFVTRVGAVRACPENAERLLDRDELLTVFPEGIKGVGKLYRDRYRLQRFGRGGYVKLALRTGTPIVPTGIVGAEEAYPLLLDGHRAAGFLGLPFLPVTPLFPWLGPLGLVPLPSRWVIAFGEPIDLSMHPPEAADDALLVNQLNEQVRTKVEELVADALGSRESAWS